MVSIIWEYEKKMVIITQTDKDSKRTNIFVTSTIYDDQESFEKWSRETLSHELEGEGIATCMKCFK